MTQFKVGDVVTLSSRATKSSASTEPRLVGAKMTIRLVRESWFDYDCAEYNNRGGTIFSADFDKVIKYEEKSMTEFKVGDKVKIKSDSKFSHQASELGIGKIVRDTSRVGTEGWFIVESTSGDYSNSYRAEDLELASAIVIGTELHKEGTSYRKVVIGEVEDDGDTYFVTKDSDDGIKSVLTQEQFKQNGWEVKREEEVKEVTLSEIADKFGIDVSKVRIKE